jgi:hypothetical protein
MRTSTDSVLTASFIYPILHTLKLCNQSAKADSFQLIVFSALKIKYEVWLSLFVTQKLTNM